MPTTKEYWQHAEECLELASKAEGLLAENHVD
jgi:hypothetical protein